MRCKNHTTVHGLLRHILHLPYSIHNNSIVSGVQSSLLTRYTCAQCDTNYKLSSLAYTLPATPPTSLHCTSSRRAPLEGREVQLVGIGSPDRDAGGGGREE